jgi:hypothetical protein
MKCLDVLGNFRPLSKLCHSVPIATLPPPLHPPPSRRPSPFHTEVHPTHTVRNEGDNVSRWPLDTVIVSSFTNFGYCVGIIIELPLITADGERWKVHIVHIELYISYIMLHSNIHFSKGDI